eukprot:jgi/Botrbrau1/7919/Bobra.9_2s0087.1
MENDEVKRLQLGFQPVGEGVLGDERTRTQFQSEDGLVSRDGERRLAVHPRDGIQSSKSRPAAECGSPVSSAASDGPDCVHVPLRKRSKCSGGPPGASKRMKRCISSDEEEGGARTRALEMVRLPPQKDAAHEKCARDADWLGLEPPAVCISPEEEQCTQSRPATLSEVPLRKRLKKSNGTAQDPQKQGAPVRFGAVPGESPARKRLRRSGDESPRGVETLCGDGSPPGDRSLRRDRSPTGDCAPSSEGGHPWECGVVERCPAVDGEAPKGIAIRPKHGEVCFATVRSRTPHHQQHNESPMNHMPGDAVPPAEATACVGGPPPPSEPRVGSGVGNLPDQATQRDHGQDPFALLDDILGYADTLGARSPPDVVPPSSGAVPYVQAVRGEPPTAAAGSRAQVVQGVPPTSGGTLEVQAANSAVQLAGPRPPSLPVPSGPAGGGGSAATTGRTQNEAPSEGKEEGMFHPGPATRPASTQQPWPFEAESCSPDSDGPCGFFLEDALEASSGRRARDSPPLRSTSPVPQDGIWGPDMAGGSAATPGPDNTPGEGGWTSAWPRHGGGPSSSELSPAGDAIVDLVSPEPAQSRLGASPVHPCGPPLRVGSPARSASSEPPWRPKSRFAAPVQGGEPPTRADEAGEPLWAPSAVPARLPNGPRSARGRRRGPWRVHWEHAPLESRHPLSTCTH